MISWPNLQVTKNLESRVGPGDNAETLIFNLGREIKTTTGFRKKIRGFGPDCSFKFELKDKKTTTIFDYFKEHHKITIK